MTTRHPLWFCALTAISLALQMPVYSDAVHPENDPLTNAKTLELIKKAFRAEDRGDLDEAIRLHKSVVQLDPKNVLSINSIAGLYGTKKNFAEEVNWAKKAIAINLKFVLAYVNCGTGLAGCGKLVEARALYEKAIQLDPNFALTYYEMGTLEEGTQNFDQALLYYKKCIALDQKFIEGHFSLGAVYANLKQFDKAKLELKKVLELQPNAEDAKQMLKQVEEDEKFELY